MANTRIHWLDNAKFVLIVLVIFGHCIDRLGQGHLSNATNTTMSFFRMPLFIYLSGFFSRLIDWSKFSKWCWGLLETYLIFTIILLIPQLFTGEDITIGSFIEPRWPLWYLISLLSWRLVVQLFARYTSPINLFIISIVLGIASGFFHLGYNFSLQRTFTFAPFFMAGYMMGNYKYDFSHIKKIPIWLAIFVIALIWIITYNVSSFPLMLFLRGRDDFAFFTGYSLWFLAILRVIMYLICFVASACFLRLIPTKESWLSLQGKDTLYYYVYHPLFIKLISALGRYYHCLPDSLPAVILYAAIIVTAIYVLLKIPFFRFVPRLFTKSYSLVFNRESENKR